MILFFVLTQLFVTYDLSTTLFFKENKLELEETSRDFSRYVNLEHLDRLSEVIHIDGVPMRITHIYSEYPDYDWVEARDEGITCVDDVSRVALVYMRHYELYGDSQSLEKAKNALKFVLYMEEEDGQFYNFIYSDHSINKEGRTSKKSFNFWAVRGLRALCYGYRVFNIIDSTYAKELREKIKPTFNQINGFLKYYGEYDFFDGVKIPKWLIVGGDRTAEVILALLDYYTVHPDDEIKVMIEKLADGLIQFQMSDSNSQLYGMHYSWRNIWHAWGNSQGQALTRAARILNNSSYLESAKREADNFYLFLLSRNFLNSVELHSDEEPIIKVFPQISYGIRPMVSGLIELSKASEDERYAKLAGLVASWLRGNNQASRIMYDVKTGRGYDGINNKEEINRNSGAESTIEALMAIMEIAVNPISITYFHYDLSETNEEENYSLYRDVSGKEIRIGWDKRLKEWSIFEN